MQVVFDKFSDKEPNNFIGHIEVYLAVEQDQVVLNDTDTEDFLINKEQYAVLKYHIEYIGKNHKCAKILPSTHRLINLN